MATLDLQGFAGEAPGLRGRLFRVLASVGRWHAQRQTTAQLSRLSGRQLRDVGIEPIHGALDGQHASLWEKPHSRPDIR